MIDIIELSLLKKRFKTTPTQVVVTGFALLILLGTFLLNLPGASKNGQPVGLVNAFFTATSAVCVTGLVVVDTGTHWTVFGQVLIAVLIQIGGLGIMTMSTLLALLLGRKITLKERLLMQESLNQFDLEGIVRLTRNIIFVTLAFELAGAIMYSLVFVPDFGWKRGIAYGTFHSITAFCNAGFDLIGDFRSFTPYVSNFIININTMLLVVIGGLGFTVWMDLYHAVKDQSTRQLSLHSKVVVATTVFLILGGALFILAVELNNPATLKQLPASGKVLASFFHSVTPRTAGFNTLDMTAATIPTKFLTIILMFIGGSPGSTAGGIKTATAAILALTVLAVIRGKEDPEVFERYLPKYLVYRALAVVTISLTLVVFVTMVLSITEKTDFLTLFFETVSAFGTVGLTMNYSPNLSLTGKLIISLTMFAGRVGPLSLMLAFAQRAGRNNGNLKYPEDRIMVG